MLRSLDALEARRIQTPPSALLNRGRLARGTAPHVGRLRPTALGDDARLVELYSGIGGSRLAIESLVTLKGVIAVDNSDAANAVYEDNFGDAPRRGNIEHLDLEALFSSDVDHVLTMSPPCQPYTRRGKGLASEDPRAQSFLRVIDTIPRMTHPPRWIFVENVVGFEVSDTREKLLEALRNGGYAVEEFIVSPTALGIPYTRARYYLIATRSVSGFTEAVPSWLTRHRLTGTRELAISDDDDDDDLSRARTLESYAIDEFDAKASLRLSDETVRKYWRWLDVVTRDSHRCSTFTSGYASTVFGGSVLLCESNSDDELKNALMRETGDRALRIDEDDVERFLGKLRWFDVEEIKALHGVPASFELKACSNKKAVFLLGNSISVDVVRSIMQFMISAG